MEYVLKSERLGFRPWTQGDLPLFRLLNQDARVMAHFPNTLPEEHVQIFFQRLADSYRENGYCYFAVDLLETSEAIGMIGLMDQNYDSDFTPSVDIGWRISPDHWRKGYASEGAAVILENANKIWGLQEVYAFATEKNLGSIKVMEQIGMEFKGSFDHPKLEDFPDLKRCVAYLWKSDSGN
ncbi:GNAT family N-acetyltransferase [Gilvibacter sp.]|uniref:GNAT family N-acetyltransferase n=1 Tax=Gilvibacter sp. TaxID=2729997 RepID=UPI003F4A85D9